METLNRILTASSSATREWSFPAAKQRVIPHVGASDRGALAKRAFDILVSGMALIFLAPLILTLIAALLILQGRPIFIGHSRIGKGDKMFPCFKFRSMVVNADAVLAEKLNDNPALKLEWDTTRKLKSDPRVTAIGKILRKSSVDELPQLWNIFRGDMSLVGPRPIVRSEAMLYGANFADYLAVRPGLTGLWQVSGRNDISFQQRVNLDADYVQNWSFKRDMVIIYKTIPAVLAAAGCY